MYIYFYATVNLFFNQLLIFIAINSPAPISDYRTMQSPITMAPASIQPPPPSSDLNVKVSPYHTSTPAYSLADSHHMINAQQKPTIATSLPPILDKPRQMHMKYTESTTKTFSDSSMINVCPNNNNNNNNNKCPNNNNVLHKPLIKMENSIKLEKPSCKSPTPMLQSSNSQMPSHLLHKIDVYGGSNTNANVAKNICSTTTLSNSVQENQNSNLNIGSTNNTSTVLHPSEMNYLSSMESSVNSMHLNQRTDFDAASAAAAAAHHSMMSNQLSLEDQYIRDQQLRYSQQISDSMNTIARPTVSYPSEIASSRVNYDLATRPYDAINGLPSSIAFERYDANCLSQRGSMYPYLQPPTTLEDINNQQKYLHEQQQMAQAMMKAEHEEHSGPLYPRPMYHYDPINGTLPPGFSAMNLSVKISEAAAAAAYKSNSVQSPNGPVIDLSTSSVTSSSPTNFNSPAYAGQRNVNSPNTGASPHLASPQVPSPQGQTLDLSVSRLSQNRYVKDFV